MNEEAALDVAGALDAITKLVSTWGVRVVGAMAVLVAGWIVAGLVRNAVRRVLERAGVDNTLVPFLTSLAYYVVLAFVGIAVLGLFGIPTASLIAVIGAMGLAIGLALQGTLSNFAAGVMILIFRPFGVGDSIEAAGVAGTVESIAMFATTMNTPDNVRIIVANSDVYGSTIKNFSANSTRRIDLVIGVSYDDDLGKAAATIERVIKADPRVLAEPVPQIAVSELGDSSVNFVVRPWCQRTDYWALRWDLTRALKEELEKDGCSIPYPQTDVHLHKVAGDAA